MFSIFKKQTVRDTNEIIYGDEFGLIRYRLLCDPEIYAKGLEKVSEHLRKWIVQDIIQTTNNNQAIETTLLFQIKDIDLKVLPYPIQKDTLLKCMTDTEINFSGSRLLDTFTRINIEVPTEVLETIKGKFLYGMIYGLPKSLGDIVYPKRQDWLNLIAEMPWCPFLVFIQDLFDSDEITSKISSMTEAIKDKGQVVVPNIKMGS